jgi:hypothetical protein
VHVKRLFGSVGLAALLMTIIAIAGFVTVPVEAATYTYNRQAAVNYALQWWNKANPAYRNFGSNDCTNFVSQCLYAGGWPMKGWNKWSLSHWFYYGYYYYSNTWTVADDFSKFLAVYSGRGQARSLAYKPWDKYFKIGDIIQIDYGRYVGDPNGPDGKWDHTMIITKVTTNEIYVTYHWASSPYVPLTSLMGKYPKARFIGYQLYDQFNG